MQMKKRKKSNKEKKRVAERHRQRKATKALKDHFVGYDKYRKKKPRKAAQCV